jgi:signal transduction histidine kinase
MMKKKLELHNLDIVLNKNQILYGIQALDSDRRRIARDLHDDISSKLNVVALNCHLLKIPDLPQKDIEEITQTIVDYTAKALESSKKMTHSLLPPVLDKFGLHAGLEELCSDLTNDKKVAIHYQNNLKLDFKEKEKPIHVYRIIEELLQNSIYHGKANKITILFSEINNKIIFEYEDNGIGFDVKSLENNFGNGYKNIVARMVILNGTFSIQSELNQGVSIVFSF